MFIFLYELFTDELGIPFDVTIDFDTSKDRTVTIRERDSTQQIRVKIEQVVPIISSLCNSSTTWATVYTQHPQVVRTDEN